jgi:D-alanyl-D-alanine dipeptidase
MRYFGENNFVGRQIDGYRAAQCMLSAEAAESLARAQLAAQSEGYSLLAFDCYRPQRAVNNFVAWARNASDTTMKAQFYPGVPKAELFARGYIASRSGHSRGSTVDLTLALGGVPVTMGTPFDYFDERSHTDHPMISGEARANRDRLRRIMEAAGFRNYAKEWWHYTLVAEPFPNTYFDRVIE